MSKDRSAKNSETWRGWFSGVSPVGDALARKYDERLWEPSEEDRSASWALYNELRSRITTHRLRYRDGHEVTALTSVYSLFPKTRELIERQGWASSHFADVTDYVLNEIVRPFTSYWHGQKESGGLDRQDNRRQFRSRLRELRQPLADFASITPTI